MIEAVAKEIDQESGDGIRPDSDIFGTVDHPLSRKFKTSMSNQDLVLDSRQEERSRSKSREAEAQLSQASKISAPGSFIGARDFAEEERQVLPTENTQNSPLYQKDSRSQIIGSFSGDVQEAKPQNDGIEIQPEE